MEQALREHATRSRGGRERRERERELLHVTEATRWITSQRGRDDGGNLGGHVGGVCPDVGRVLAHHRGGKLGRRPDPRRATGEELEQDDAERPDVGARVDVLRRAYLLGRHVHRGADHAVCDRELGIAVGLDLGDPEVEDLHRPRLVRVAFLRKEQVRWLQIAMDDADLVRGDHGGARLEHDVDGLRVRQTAPPIELDLEVMALEELHHHVRQAVGSDVDIHHAHRVPVAKLSRRACFALEARHDDVVREHLGQEHLHGYTLAQLEMRRLEDDTHAALADDLHNRVLSRDHLPRYGQRVRGRLTLARDHRPDRIASDASVANSEARPFTAAARCVTWTGSDAAELSTLTRRACGLRGRIDRGRRGGVADSLE